MERHDLTSELLARAFRLAWFIHCDRQLAVRIATEAMARLEVAVAAQDKRLYYKPAGRTPQEGAKGAGYRTKVSVGEQHLLQRLVYVTSDPLERQTEQDAVAISRDDMLVRFIKYLVQITVRRNSFYVTLGLSRLLHDYSTAETMELYQIVVQNPERVRDDYYYRSRKGKLMQELRERFGDRISVTRGARGEERFQSAPTNDRLTTLVQECLEAFTPWRTDCAVPDNIDRFGAEIRALSFVGADPDAEHTVEVSRFHAVLHPDCYARLAASLNLESPRQRLAAPLFPMHRDHDQHQPPRSRRAPEPDSEEISAISSLLAEQAAHRKYVGAGLLRILVDGRECAQLDLRQTSRASFAVGEEEDLIEVRTAVSDGDVLLATHLLTQDETAGRNQQLAITLEDGQQLLFALNAVSASAGNQQTMIDLTWRETRLSRAVALWCRQRASALTAGWQAGGLRKPALVFASLLLLALSLLAYLQLKPQPEPVIVRQPAPTPEIVVPQVTPTPEATPAPAPNRPLQLPPAPRPEKTAPQSAPLPQLAERNQQRAPQPDVPQPEPFIVPDSVIAEDTRGTKLAADEKELLAVRKIYVDPFGSEAGATDLRTQLIAALRAQTRLTLTGNRNEADAVLKGRIITTRDQQVTLTTRLVNEAGTVVWPVKGPLSGRQYQGTINTVAAQIVKDLLADMQKAERR